MGVLPFSRFWASNKPFGAPLAGLALQWLMCVIVILARCRAQNGRWCIRERRPPSSYGSEFMMSLHYKDPSSPESI